MPIAVGRLVALALGYLSPPHDLAHVRGHDTVSTDGLSDGFLDGFIPQPALDGRPPQVGFRRPQQAERMKRDCLSNGTNFCFGDSSSYCSSCGTCCSSSSNSNNKWCCPSGGICCGSSCCGSGQTCNNGQCYLPVETITATSSIAITSTLVVTSLTTIFQKVLESSVTKSIVEVTNTNAQTQTNWVYVTATTVGKRAEPTELSFEDTSGSSDSTSLEGLGGLGGTSDHSSVGALSEIASTTANGATTSTLPLPIQSTTPVMPFIAPVLVPSTEPAASTEAIASEPILPRQALTEANTMAATRSTSTVVQGVTATSIVTSVIALTTTVVTTSTDIQTVFQTNTVVLDAKTTVEATSTWTYTSHRPVTVTLTEIATAPNSNTGSATSSIAAPALVTSVTDGILPKANLSSSAIAGIAIGATVFGIAFCMAIFYISRRHLARTKERKAITEDYAYLGTGRSDFDGPARSNSGSGSSPPMIMHNSYYSGPPPPSARMSSVRNPATSHVDPRGNERGLPPIPWYSAAAKTSPPTSPISPTSGSLPFSNELNQQVSPTSPAYSRANHVRSGSAQTAGTATSSTVVGGSSNRNSVRSNSGKTARFSNGGIPHKRASSSGSGSGSGTVNETANDAQGEAAANVPTVEVTPVTPAVPVAPSELPSIPAPRAYLSPDPPSPMLQPQLGPLRIVNGPMEADDPSDLDEPMPKAPPRAR